MDSKIVDLEIKLAYLENLVETLNDVVTSQQEEINSVDQRMIKLERVIASQADSGIKDISQEVPPPHY